MDNGFKARILTLRESGMSYRQIESVLGCSRAVISYHCTRAGLNDIGLSLTKFGDGIGDDSIVEYYKTHTLAETSAKYGISSTTVKKYGGKKLIPMGDDERKQRSVTRIVNFRQRMKQRAVEYMGGKCIECGYDRCIWALEFHHKNPLEKDFAISQYLNLKWESVKAELDKCIMVCSNCHKELHHGQTL